MSDIDNVTILAIETSSETCSAALYSMKWQDDAYLPSIVYRCDPTPRQHTKLILKMLDEVLTEGEIELKDVDAIAFGQGPGAFTGLRIAAGVAQGIALSVDKPVVPVSTLATLAVQTVDMIMSIDGDYNEEILAVAMDARMGEVYWGIFRLDENLKLKIIGEEKVSKPQEMFDKVLALSESAPNTRIFCTGAGWDVYEEDLFKGDKPENIKHIKFFQPNAEGVVQVALDLFMDGKTVAPEDAQPVYLRNNVAKKSQKKT